MGWRIWPNLIGRNRKAQVLLTRPALYTKTRVINRYMKEELAKQLKEAGFPNITRWEVENNYRRSISVTGEETLAPLGALLSEMDSVLLVKGGEEWAATKESAWIEEREYADTPANRESGCVGKKYHSGYIDTGNTSFCIGSTPEEAVAKLWLTPPHSNK